MSGSSDVSWYATPVEQSAQALPPIGLEVCRTLHEELVPIAVEELVARGGDGGKGINRRGASYGGDPRDPHPDDDWGRPSRTI